MRNDSPWILYVAWAALAIALFLWNPFGNFVAALFIVAGSSFVITYGTVPFVIQRMRLRKIVGKDMNKIGKPLVPEMGGIAIFFGFCFGVLVAIFLASFFHLIRVDLPILFAGFSTILLTAFLGVFDDLIGWRHGIRKYQHALVPIFAALPLMAIKAGETAMAVPGIGVVDFGIWYPLLLVPLGVAGASNALNMLAGLNGLEAGLGIILAGTMFLLSLLSGHMEAAIIMLCMLGALLAFIRFNWFPARIFPGDATTLMVGASIAVASIIGNMERIGIMLLALFFVELILKAKVGFQVESFGVPKKDGTLRAPEKIGSVTHWVMKRGNFTEKQVVLIILGFQVLVSLSVIAYWYLNSIEFFNDVANWLV